MIAQSDSEGSDLWPHHGADVSLRAQARVVAALERNGRWGAPATSEAPSSIITLVHGTWGRESQLAADDSSFCMKLSHELGDDCKFQIFRWSGDNCHTARLAAAIRLRECIRDTAESFPNSSQFIVAHSHGGNIVLYALRDETVARHVVGAITLATPFIHATRRRIPPALRRAIRFFDAGHVLLGSALLLLLVSFALHLVETPVLRLAGALAGLFSTVLVFSSFFSKRFWPAPDFGHQLDIERAFALPTSLSTETLILKSSADEAHGVLSTGSFMSWLFNRVIGHIINVTAAIREHSLLKFFMILFLIGSLIALVSWAQLWPAKSDGAHHPFIELVIEYYRVPGLIFGGLVAFIYLNTFMLALISWVASRPFGRGIGLAVALNLVLSAEDTPPGGPWNVFSVPESLNARRRATEGWDWMHDQAYISPKAITIISLWIRGGANAGRIFQEMRSEISRIISAIDEIPPERKFRRR